MNASQLLDDIEMILLARSLNPIERLVLNGAWHGKTYVDMAENSGYGSAYIKEVGSQLWTDLSQAVGQRVTKKNIRLVLEPYMLLQRQTRTELPPQRDDLTLGQPLLSSQLSAEDLLQNPPFPTGTIPLNSPFYIERPPVEELAFQEIHRPGCLIRLRAPSKMGKSSLIARMMAHAQQHHYRTVLVDFQEADQDVFDNLNRFLRWFCAYISRQLGLDPQLDRYWDSEMGSKVSCRVYFEQCLLSASGAPLFIAINEVSRIFNHDAIVHDFLPMLRFWHEQGQHHPAWQGLRLAIAYTTELCIPLHLNQSPFNVGLSLRLPYFSFEQCQELVNRYQIHHYDPTAIAQQLYELLNGHPYLTHIALYHLRQSQTSLEDLLATAPTASGIYGAHLQPMLVALKDDPHLCELLTTIMRQDTNVPIDAIAAYKLDSMGLIHLEGNCATPSCKLYQLFFQEQLQF
jgi:hypothetical protein